MDHPADGRVSLDGATLKLLRAKCGLSQEALAERCVARRLCVSIASIKRAETGRPVLYRTARGLAEVFGVPLEQLWGRTAPARPSTLAPNAADFGFN